MTVQIEDMNWSIYSDTSGDNPDTWVKDYSTSAPDGTYTFRTDMFDYRSADNNEWPPKQDYVFLQWESGLEVSVKDGCFEPSEALAAAGHLMYSCGYHGRYIEGLDYNSATKSFNLTVGS